ncbi:pseudouridine synthase [Mycena metata]|uniref:tRNA pseudouridine synthase n=1 Tax=Mycena metata TaxID=1033252 RepID=A0AAD7K534_9AGAR|nr:pseudouridine synthase [Mycena metata]
MAPAPEFKDNEISNRGQESLQLPKQKYPWKTFDFSSYPRRKIALKFCYSGWAYNGLAIQLDPTPLPTVEGVLFEALAKARLVDRDAGLEGCGWERCGRTDRGVSAGGQVISLWVRSALNNVPTEPPDAKPVILERDPPPEASEEALDSDDAFPLDGDFGSLDDMYIPPPAKIPRKSEHNYTAVLNRILPSTIRVLAWSPVAPDFSSRFACISRHYKYFFAPDGLDIPRMREAASLLVGGHDFRNFCKLDPTKQLTTYRRKIISADINPVAGGTAVGMHVLDLKGSAFLYHQVRHIMAILFLVGAGLEPPSVVTALLNVEVGAEGDPSLPVVDTRPEYQMADALPLMLYECHYSPGDVKWQAEQEDDAELGAGLYHQMHSIQARSELFAVLNREFLTAAAAHHAPPTSYLPLTATGFVPDGKTPMNVPLGGAEFRRSVKYTPLLQRNRGDHFEVVNERWRVGKGARRDERRKLLDDGGNE